ncbi:MAG: response regulator [Saprospiraceae bacterium]
MRSLVKAMLPEHDIIEAWTGGGALTILHERLDIDLILLDWMLPDITGISVLKAMPPDHPPVIMVTAKLLYEDHMAAEKAGAAGYITKSFVLKNLRDEVERVAGN